MYESFPEQFAVVFVDFWGCLLTTLRGDAKQMQEVLLDRWCSAYVR